MTQVLVIGLMIASIGFMVGTYKAVNKKEKGELQMKVRVFGFRSKKPWKMAVAGFTYALIVMIAIIAIINPSSGGGKNVADEQATQALNTYLKDNFSGTSWYAGMKEVTVKNGVATIKTDYYPDAEGKTFAEKLTFAPFALANEKGSTVKIQQVVVRGLNDSYVLTKNNPLY